MFALSASTDAGCVITETDSWPYLSRGSRAADCSHYRFPRSRHLHVLRHGHVNTYWPHCPGWVWKFIYNYNS